MNEHPSSKPKPLLIYDGQCGFCRRWIHRWTFVTGDRIDYAPYQEVAERFPNIAPEHFKQAAHLVEPDGTVYRGAHAILRSTASAPGHGRWLWLYEHVPGVAPAAELGYRVVASNRYLLSGLTTFFWGRNLEPAGFLLTRWFFVRLLGLIYLIAFASLAVQILGLVGSHGIVPAAEFLDRAHDQLGSDAYWRLPTLAWLNCSDNALLLLCWGGVGVSVLIVLRIAPALMLLIAWALYLSLYHVGQSFLSFQWDILLLETGFLGIFYAPWNLRPRLATERKPSRVVRWLLLLLLFKLMFSSGVVKLLDDSKQDPTWHELTALNYHYETTCIPNTGSWYAHQAPEWFQKFSVVCMFIIELGIPFLIFLPRNAKIFAFFPLILFQLIIMATGNYNFFNGLAILLCIPLLDDKFIRRFLPKGFASRAASGWSRTRPWIVQRMLILPVTALVLVLQIMWMSHTLRDREKPWSQDRFPKAARWMFQHSRPFAVASPYGLFRAMTTRRPEIIIEGSNDRKTWLAYEFKWKPGDLKRRPRQVAPHQPRLDWQMWFAALGGARQRVWFVPFMKRLLEGSPEVLALLANNPFPDAAPKYVRATLYDYHFTDWETRSLDGSWWTRTRLRAYTPEISLRSFRRR